MGEHASVALTVGIGIPDEEIWKISRARKTSEKVPLHALRELAGDWQILKKYLPEEIRARVAFKPNDPGAVVKKYEQEKFMKVAPLLPDVLLLEGHPDCRGLGEVRAQDGQRALGSVQGGRQVQCSLLWQVQGVLDCFL